MPHFTVSEQESDIQNHILGRPKPTKMDKNRKSDHYSPPLFLQSWKLLSMYDVCIMMCDGKKVTDQPPNGKMWCKMRSIQRSLLGE